MFIGERTDPFEAFHAVLLRVRATAPDGFDPDTVALATADPGGRPSVRMVLLRGRDEDGFLFYTNHGSRKAAELGANPRAALCGFWFWLKQQVRIEGTIVPATPAESDAYFQSRPRGSRLGAWASKQSTVIGSRAELEDALRNVEVRFPGDDVPRPPFWGGYHLVPERFEFWEEGEYRLHDRMLFERRADGWTRTRLAP